MKPKVFKIAIALAFASLTANASATPSETTRHYLSGTDKDSDVQWDFMCT